ncbi:unnamed protein product [Ectocarpus sp. 13 AM-2016]
MPFFAWWWMHNVGLASTELSDAHAIQTPGGRWWRRCHHTKMSAVVCAGRVALISSSLLPPRSMEKRWPRQVAKHHQTTGSSTLPCPLSQLLSFAGGFRLFLSPAVLRKTPVLLLLLLLLLLLSLYLSLLCCRQDEQEGRPKGQQEEDGGPHDPQGVVRHQGALHLPSAQPGQDSCDAYQGN